MGTVEQAVSAMTWRLGALRRAAARPAPRRRHVVAGLAVLALGSTTACSAVPGLSDPLAGAEEAAEELASALADRDLSDVPVTDDSEPEGGAAAALEEVVAGMGDREPEVTVTDVSEATPEGPDEEEPRAAVELAWSWPLGGSEWSHTSEAVLVPAGEERWELEWAPSVVEETLTDRERLRARTLEARRGDILGAGDEPLVTLREVVRLGVDKTQVGPRDAVRAARRLAGVVDVDRAGYVDRVRAAGDEAFVEAITLRAAEARPVTGPASAINGVAVIADQLPLAPDRTFAAPILGTYGEATAELIEESDGELEVGDSVGLSGLQARYEDRLAGEPGVTVEAVGPDGQGRELHEVEPTHGEPLRTTLDHDTQELAEQVLSDLGPPSALVAVRPSDGALVAAASGPGSDGANTATYGRYPPGSTFKAVSALALLRAGMDPGTPVRCTPTATVDGREFGNYSDYPPSELGRITLADAVAHSCNTAFINARDRVGEGDLADAAAALGLGVDHDVGFPAYFGQVPPAETATGAAADLIGQGTVLASPMSMATVAASVVAGEAVLPRLVRGLEVDRVEPGTPLRRGEAQALRRMLRGVVERGSGAGLADVPGPPVLAKTGTAEYGDATRTHAWMIAAQGDLAVAVFVGTGDSGSGTAGPVLEQFLRGVR